MPDGVSRRARWTAVLSIHPWITLVLAALFVAAAAVAGSGVGDRLDSGGYDAPHSESSRTARTLERVAPGSQPNLVLLVSSRPGTVDSAAVAAAGRRVEARLRAEPQVTGVVSYWDTRSPALRSGNGDEALITARITGTDTAAAKVLHRVGPALVGVHGPVRVRVGGPVAVSDQVQHIVKDDLGRAEAVALPITLVLLILVFGSAVAAMLPLAIGIVSVLGTDAVLRGISELTSVSVYAQNLTTALGLGLAIDYSLFVVRRFREELPAAQDVPAAVATTLRTAGRTVVVSALTVAASLSALLIFPQVFLRSCAYAGIAVVLLAAAAALVVLPALLVLLGNRVNALDVRVLLRRRRSSPAPADGRPAAWRQLGAAVMRRAPYVAVATTALLVLLGLPFLRVHFGTTDDRQLPAGAESRVVQDHVRGDFPGDPGGAVTVRFDGTVRAEDVRAYTRRISLLPDVRQADGPQGVFTRGSLAQPPGPGAAAMTASDGSHLVLVQLRGEPADAAAQSLVRTLRTTGGAPHAAVTGPAAALVDSKDAIAGRLPWAAAIIAAVTLLLVFLLTGSVLVPLQAVVLNALSLTAMFGAVVWVFQDGHFSSALGFTPTGDIETTLPVLMFCVAFGLSMDYGVFLLSRMKERYDRTGDHQEAVLFGLQRTGGLITAAALILAVVMVAIGMSRVTDSKMLGLGVALAVLMDAAVVRSLLVPAVMRLTGPATWWAPAFLRSVHRRFGLREAGPEPAAPEGADTELAAPRPQRTGR